MALRLGFWRSTSVGICVSKAALCAIGRVRASCDTNAVPDRFLQSMRVRLPGSGQWYSSVKPHDFTSGSGGCPRLGTEPILQVLRCTEPRTRSLNQQQIDLETVARVVDPLQQAPPRPRPMSINPQRLVCPLIHPLTRKRQVLTPRIPALTSRPGGPRPQHSAPATAPDQPQHPATWLALPQASGALPPATE